MMKTNLFKYFSIFLMLSGTALLNAQTSAINKLYLSNYSFIPSMENAFVCKIMVNSKKPYSIKFSGENADLFILNNNELSLTEKGLNFFKNNNRVSLLVQITRGKKVILARSFILLKDEFTKNGVIAHRGAWKNKNFPHNSIAALQNAINLGCEGSEFDVNLTADNVVVVYHDSKINGMTIEKSNYADIRKQLLENGEPIPTLEEHIKIAMQQQKMRLVCELKPSIISKERSMLLAEKVFEKVSELKAQAWMVFISFDYDILKKIIEIESSFQTMYLMGNVTSAKLKADGVYGADYHYSVYQRNTEWISEAHQNGIAVNAWTVNDSLIMDYLIAHNADYITTDEPELLLRQIAANKGPRSQKLVWSDEFNYKGLPDSTKWSYDVGGHGWGNNELQYYTKADTQNVFVEKGMLSITIRKEPKVNREYTSTRLVSKNKGDWLYGKIEIRAHLPKGRGLWPAIWMLPTDNIYGGWPSSGEIDIMEHVGYSPDSVFQTVHTKDFNHMIGTQVSTGFKILDVYNKFHVYSIDWKEDKIDFMVDGHIHLTFNNSNKSFGEWPFDKKFHLIMNIAVGGWGGKKGIDNTIFPVTMEIDYVRVYQNL